MQDLVLFKLFHVKEKFHCFLPTKLYSSKNYLWIIKVGSILHRKMNYKKYFSIPILILAKCDSSPHVNLAQEVLKE